MAKNNGINKILINAKINAFTLAEIFITLAIICIVAVAVSFAVKSNYSEDIFADQLKSTVSVINHGFKRLQNNEDVIFLDDTSLFGQGGNLDNPDVEAKITKTLKKTFPALKDINREDLEGKGLDCKALVKKSAYRWHLGDKTKCSGNFNKGYEFASGAIMYIYLYNKCVPSNISGDIISAHGGELIRLCGSIDLDVNGTKKPNQWGKDSFKFFITQNGTLVPLGGKDYWYYKGTFDKSKIENAIMGNCNSNNPASKGFSCAARVMELDNWKIVY